MKFLVTQLFFVSFFLGTAFTAVKNFEMDQPKGNPDATVKEIKYVVEMKVGIEPALALVKSLKFINKQEKVAKLTRSLKELSQSSQHRVMTFLENYKRTKKPEFRYESLWTVNHIVLRDPEAWLIQKVSEFEEVNEVRPEIFFHIIPILQDMAVGKATVLRDDSMKTPIVRETWGLISTQQPEAVAYLATLNTTNHTIGLLDTGAMRGHEEFEGRLYSDYYSGEDGCTDGIDRNGHGTHCCGTVAAKNYGMYPTASIFSIKGLNAQGSGGEVGLSNCFKIGCFDLLVSVVSASWGSYSRSKLIADAISGCEAVGVISVVAGGNGGCMPKSNVWPAALDSTISVAATDQNDNMTCWTSCNQIPNDSAAPGLSILSTWYTSNTATAYLSGTSMACPHVAALAGMLKSVYPQMTKADMLQCLKETCTPVGGEACYAYNQSNGQCTSMDYPKPPCWGAGEIQAYDALKWIQALKESRVAEAAAT